LPPGFPWELQSGDSMSKKWIIVLVVIGLIIALVVFVPGVLYVMGMWVASLLDWLVGRPSAVLQDPWGEGTYTAMFILVPWLVWWGIPKYLRKRKAKRDSEANH